MKYVAITKRIKHLDKVEAHHKGLPHEYPIECAEFEEYSHAVESHPEAEIMTFDEYQAYQKGVQMLFNHVKSQKSKWKFWQKG